MVTAPYQNGDIVPSKVLSVTEHVLLERLNPDAKYTEEPTPRIVLFAIHSQLPPEKFTTL